MGRGWLQENGLQGMRPLLTAFLRSRADSVSCRRPGLAEAWGGAGPRPAPGAPRRRKLGAKSTPSHLGPSRSWPRGGLKDVPRTRRCTSATVQPLRRQQGDADFLPRQPAYPVGAQPPPAGGRILSYSAVTGAPFGPEVPGDSPNAPVSDTRRPANVPPNGGRLHGRDPDPAGTRASQGRPDRQEVPEADTEDSPPELPSPNRCPPPGRRTSGEATREAQTDARPRLTPPKHHRPLRGRASGRLESGAQQVDAVPAGPTERAALGPRSGQPSPVARLTCPSRGRRKSC